MWVKICGITCAEDARLAFEAGADAIGLNFVGGRRRITVDDAAAVLEVVPKERMAVGLVTLGPEGLDTALKALLTACHVQHVQLYGDVSPPQIARLVQQGRRPLLVCRLGKGDPEQALNSALAGRMPNDLFAVLLDTHMPGQPGGTGKTLDWAALADARVRGVLEGLPPIILAGGLKPGNVARALELVRPWGVDVSSGVEHRPGRKDPRAVREFIRAAKGAPWF